MYEIDKEIANVLESYGIDLKSRLNEMSLKCLIVDCPRCGGKNRIAFDPSEITSKVAGNGVVNVIVNLSCSHVFIAHVGRDLKVRGMLEVTTGVHVSSERLDIRFMKEQERALEELHSKMVEEGTTDMQYKVFSELARVRKVMASIK